MSSSGGAREDAANAINAGRETVGIALRTLQKKLQVAFIVFVVGLVGGVLAMRWYIWPQLKADLLATGARVITQTPFDVILMQVKIGLAVGVLLTIPVLLYYAREPLEARDIIPDVHVDRWKVAVLGLFAAGLFVVGVTYAYGLFFPIVFTFLANYAAKAGLAPMYSIVMWTEFILVLALSFGLAAQLPLAMSAFAYAEIVRYETFRDKWKYAVVGIFAFGAVFSPPDPFTQILWAIPLLFLYGVSLYLTKIVVTAKRGSERIDVTSIVRDRWNVALGSAVVGFAVGYGAYAYGAVTRLNDALAGTSVYPQKYLLPQYDPVPVGVALAALGLVAGLAYVVYDAIEEAAAAEAAVYGGKPPSPENLNLDVLDAAGVRAAPPERFANMTEEEALAAARAAMDEGDDEKARAILDRFDEAQEGAEGDAETEAAEAESGTVEQRAAGMLDAFTEEETTEEDIGGYYHDIAFILDSLRSRAMYIVGAFMGVLVAAFAFLYYGGLRAIRNDFIGRIPPSVRPNNTSAPGAPVPNPGEAVGNWPITLHPVEALVFEAKVSAIAGLIVLFPLAVYYAWPALADRGIVTGDRRTILVWAGGLFAGLAVGSVVGYLFVAPNVITWLVVDALQANMVISYRISSFLWLVFLTTAGIGLLLDVPVTMVLFHAGGIVSFEAMRNRWRVAVLGSFALGALVTPDSVYTMLIIGVPLTFAYFVGLGLLWIGTLGGRRGGGPTPERTP